MWKFGLIEYSNRVDLALCNETTGKATVLWTFTPGTEHEQGAREAVQRGKDLKPELSQLFEVCREDHEYDTLHELAIKAGLMWHCNCGDYQAIGRACDACGKTERPPPGRCVSKIKHTCSQHNPNCYLEPVDEENDDANDQG